MYENWEELFHAKPCEPAWTIAKKLIEQKGLEYAASRTSYLNALWAAEWGKEPVLKALIAAHKHPQVVAKAARNLDDEPVEIPPPNLNNTSPYGNWAIWRAAKRLADTNTDQANEYVRLLVQRASLELLDTILRDGQNWLADDVKDALNARSEPGFFYVFRYSAGECIAVDVCDGDGVRKLLPQHKGSLPEPGATLVVDETIWYSRIIVPAGVIGEHLADQTAPEELKLTYNELLEYIFPDDYPEARGCQAWDDSLSGELDIPEHLYGAYKIWVHEDNIVPLANLEAFARSATVVSDNVSIGDSFIAVPALYRGVVTDAFEQFCEDMAYLRYAVILDENIYSDMENNYFMAHLYDTLHDVRFELETIECPALTAFLETLDDTAVEEKARELTETSADSEDYYVLVYQTLCELTGADYRNLKEFFPDRPFSSNWEAFAFLLHMCGLETALEERRHTRSDLWKHSHREDVLRDCVKFEKGLPENTQVLIRPDVAAYSLAEDTPTPEAWLFAAHQDAGGFATAITDPDAQAVYARYGTDPEKLQQCLDSWVFGNSGPGAYDTYDLGADGILNNPHAPEAMRAEAERVRDYQIIALSTTGDLANVSYIEHAIVSVTDQDSGQRKYDIRCKRLSYERYKIPGPNDWLSIVGIETPRRGPGWKAEQFTVLQYQGMARIEFKF